jgi:hypothetical protein
MTAFGIAARSAWVATAAAIMGIAVHYPAVAAAPPDKVLLVPHRAVYQLKLLRSSGSRAIEGVRGRILYDFSGNACDGYDLQFRQVSELDSGEGKNALSDLSATTWEDGAARKFRFNSENKLNQQSADRVDGTAERKADAVTVNLHKPSDKTFSIPADAVFPTEHMRKIIVAARAGKKIVELKVYDGAETGEKVYDTLTVIGRSIAPGERVPQDAAAKEPALAKLSRWPVTISYFERSAKTERSSEQTPVYSISFELYDNGISRALTLDYSDFSITGEMTSLEIKTAKSCP